MKFWFKGTTKMRNSRSTLQLENTKNFNFTIKKHHVFKPRNQKVSEIKVMVEGNR